VSAPPHRPLLVQPRYRRWARRSSRLRIARWKLEVDSGVAPVSGHDAYVPPAADSQRPAPTMRVTEWAHRQYEAVERVVVAGRPCVRLAASLDDDIEPFSDDDDEGDAGDGLQLWAKRRPLHPVLAARVGGNVSGGPARPAKLQIERVRVAHVARPGAPPARIVDGHLLVGSGSSGGGGTWHRMDPAEWARMHRPRTAAQVHAHINGAVADGGRKLQPGPWLSTRSGALR